MSKLRHIILLMLLRLAAFPTSIILKVDHDKAIMAADNLQTELKDKGQISHHEGCKVSKFERGAFSSVYYSEYSPNDPKDNVPKWDARRDAESAYSVNGPNIRATAKYWVDKAAAHYRRFLEVYPDRVSHLALQNREHLLVVGFFAGWDQSPLVMEEEVLLDINPPHHVQTIQIKERVLGYRAQPYASHEITEELMEGKSDRAKRARQEFARKSYLWSENWREWQALAFFITETSKYDHNVGKSVDIVEVGTRSEWIQQTSCK